MRTLHKGCLDMPFDEYIEWVMLGFNPPSIVGVSPKWALKEYHIPHYLLARSPWPPNCVQPLAAPRLDLCGRASAGGLCTRPRGGGGGGIQNKSSCAPSLTHSCCCLSPGSPNSHSSKSSSSLTFIQHLLCV